MIKLHADFLSDLIYSDFLLEQKYCLLGPYESYLFLTAHTNFVFFSINETLPLLKLEITCLMDYFSLKVYCEFLIHSFCAFQMLMLICETLKNTFLNTHYSKTLKCIHVLKHHVHHIIPFSGIPQSHRQLQRFSVSGLKL